MKPFLDHLKFKFNENTSLMTKGSMSLVAAGNLCSSIRTTFERKNVEPSISEKLLDQFYKLTTLKLIYKSSNCQNVEIEQPALLV